MLPRVIRPDGIYELGGANPFAVGISTQSLTGRANELSGLCQKGEESDYLDEE